MPKATPDFRFKQFTLRHKENAMKFGTDAAILGALAAQESAERVMDVGCGTAVLLLMAAHANTFRQGLGIECIPEHAAEAQYNASQFPLSENISITCNDFNNVEAWPCDLMLSNPPYFLGGAKSPEANRMSARNQEGLGPHALLNGINKHLVDTGVAMIIYPANEADSLIDLIPEYKLHLHQVLSVKSFAEDTKVVRKVLWIKKQAATKLHTETKYIYISPKTYSPWFIDLLKPFYLYL